MLTLQQRRVAINMDDLIHLYEEREEKISCVYLFIWNLFLYIMLAHHSEPDTLASEAKDSFDTDCSVHIPEGQHQ